MNDHPFEYTCNFLIKTDLGCNLRSGARFKGLDEVRPVEYLKILLKVDNNGHPSWLLKFFVRRYNLLLSLDNVGNLSSSKLNFVSP